MVHLPEILRGDSVRCQQAVVHHWQRHHYRSCYPRIDTPQIRDLGFIIADDQGFWQELKTPPEPALELDDPHVHLPIIRHHHERFDFTLKVCADPDRDVLLIDFQLEGDPELQPYLLCSTRPGEDAENDCAWIGNWVRRSFRKTPRNTSAWCPRRRPGPVRRRWIDRAALKMNRTPGGGRRRRRCA